MPNFIFCIRICNKISQLVCSLGSLFSILNKIGRIVILYVMYCTKLTDSHGFKMLPLKLVSDHVNNGWDNNGMHKS